MSREFTVRCHDAFLSAVAPILVRTAGDLAPGVLLRLAGEGPSDDRDLSRGAVDLSVGCPPATAGTSSIASQVIGTDEMVLIVPRGHAADVAAPSVEQIAQSAHVVVSQQPLRAGPVDEILDRLGLRRQVIAVVPTVSAALAVTAASAVVTVLPRRLRDPLPPGLRARPLPFRLTTPPVTVNWHRRQTADPAHAWLRKVVAGVLTDVLAA
ncbi:LysR substrate-binding domain-containing protein [Actinoplanes awajinensis]|uniref:LysR substrate-binding domain-containing protein n=1 Tax=Actinoplanes awajinensis TaxID=135946 RepID=UPI0018DC3272|nr:LysR substrate-binding domain-containing protein [Actinoplanes awajinensis]